MSIRISVIVCTYNRSPYLIKSLQSLDNQTLDPTLYEVIVVDNASTDNTREVFDEYSSRLNWRYISEPVLGLARARNTGWQNALGPYIAYLDDDAVAQPTWLAKIVETFETFKPRPACVGGKITPIWEAPRPNWLSDGLLSFLSVVDWSETPIVLDEKRGIPGCNISYPREVLQAIGGFRECLGRQGNNLLGNEEIYVRQQLELRGLCSVYHPEVEVYHHIVASRLTKRWFRERAYWQGRSDAFLIIIDKTPSTGFRIKLALERIGWALPRLVLIFISVNSAAHFRRQCQILASIGYISGLWQRET